IWSPDLAPKRHWRNLVPRGTELFWPSCIVRTDLHPAWPTTVNTSSEGDVLMSLYAAIAPHLPYLRRFSRAVSGSQDSGDAMVAAMLEAIIADVDIFPKASSDRIA